MRSRSKIALFQINTILIFDFQERKKTIFFGRTLFELYKKDINLHVTITFFPKTRGNKDKQWTHYSALKTFQNVSSYLQ